MRIPAPHIIKKIEEERERQRQPAQIPLRIEVPRYQPDDQYGGREPLKAPERGIAEIDYCMRSQNQGGLEYIANEPKFS